MSNIHVTRRADQGGRWLVGIALIVIGALALIGEFAGPNYFGLLFLPALGLFFLTWGIVSYRPALLIPGGILFGIGLGAFVTSTFLGNARAFEAGAFLLCFALGWALITVTNGLFLHRRCVWPLIPAGILALIGILQLAGDHGQLMARWLGTLWPAGLIFVGVWLLLFRKGSRASHKVK